MELEIIHNPKDNRFETHVEGSTAYVEYIKLEDNILSVTSTLVPKDLEGKGIAGMITKHVLEYARENHLTVEPICSYTVAYLNKHPEYNDVLKQEDNK